MIPRLPVAIALLAALAFLGDAPRAEATSSYRERDARACRPVVKGVLVKLGIPESDVRYMDLQPRVRQSRQRSRVIGLDAWVGLKSCGGSIVIDMSTTCRVRQVYGKDGCENLPGLDAF